MAVQVQFRRGNTSQHSTFTGAEGEITVNTDKDTLIVHDGTTVGGHELASSSGLSSNVATLTANNTSFVGTVSAANVVSNAQLSANLGNYQTTAGLAANVATLTANNTSFVGTVSAANVVSNAQLSGNLSNYAALTGATFTGAVNVTDNFTVTGNLIVTGTTFTANVTNLDVKDLNITVAKGAVTAAAADGAGLTVDTANVGWYYNYSSNTWQANVGITPSTNSSFNLGSSSLYWANLYANNIVSVNLYGTLQTTNQPNITANNTSFVGTISAANVVSNAQLSANLGNYQTTAGLSANVATLTANNTSFVGSISSVNVVSNTQLQSNLTNYVLTSSINTLSVNSAAFIGTLPAADVVSNAQLVANLSNYQTGAGLSSNVATLTANNTSFVGTISAANVVSNAQLSANLSNYQTTAGLAANVAALTANLTFANLSDTADLTIDRFYMSATTMMNVTNDGASAYRFDQYGASNNPVVYVSSDTTIAFNLNVTGHPFLIKSSNGTNYNEGLTHVTIDGVVTTGANAQGKTSGTLYWKIPAGTLGDYRYQCSIHGGMVGDINISAHQTVAGLAANVATLTANNTSNFNSQPASFYTNATNINTGTLPYAQIPVNVINTTADFTRTGVTTFSANIIIGTSAGISSNGSFGTAGQVLTSNATSVYWSTVAAGGFTNGQSISVNNFVVTGSITANGSNGDAGYVLHSNGSSAYWAGSSAAAAAAVREQFTGNGSNTSFTVAGGYASNSLSVFINGVLVRNSVDVDVTNGSNILFTAAPPNNALIDVIGNQAFTGVSPSFSDSIVASFLTGL